MLEMLEREKGMESGKKYIKLNKSRKNPGTIEKTTKEGLLCISSLTFALFKKGSIEKCTGLEKWRRRVRPILKMQLKIFMIFWLGSSPTTFSHNIIHLGIF